MADYVIPKIENDLSAKVLWGNQTQLSLRYFNIGTQGFAPAFIQCLIHIKRAAAEVNSDNGLLPARYSKAILAACDELLQNDHDKQFPLRIWQTGSGTQTHMNVNEVISTLANEFFQNQSSEDIREHIHPNDHVNMSQSSNDVFPSAMHLVVANLTHNTLLKSLKDLINQLDEKQREYKTLLTVGRTHLMDALPLPVSAVFSGYCAQLIQAKSAIRESLNGVYQLAIGGTAVGGGDNAPSHFGAQMALKLANHYLLPLRVADNTYAAVSGEDALLRYSNSLKQLASVLFKIANDFKLLGSGPRCGFNEWSLAANEPGSSIMPGKVNPTQCEALSMVCLQVFGNDLTVSLAASNGQLQLNTYRPAIIHNVMESIELLSDAIKSFTQHCVDGLTLNRSQISTNMTQNLSVITLLAPTLGYDVAAQIAHTANSKRLSIAEAAEELGYYTAIEFQQLLDEKLQLKR
ncbi:class II fumarate hydratase [Alteromonas flava]|uniref:class II fumarate hydratase n=1 Tax=Alteromonas flava TaxID=2048003 RepID=UPI000C281EEF|nr:class II fumarate hydratase [Alteromonas flava]